MFLPSFFIDTLGFTLVEWLRLLSVIFASNIIWNLLFGMLGDRWDGAKPLRSAAGSDAH